MQSSIIEQFRGRTIDVTGDGQFDSPGFTARYCFYTFVEATSKLVVDFYVAEKTQVSNVYMYRYTMVYSKTSVEDPDSGSGAFLTP
jgi:hypothetical protein